MTEAMRLRNCLADLVEQIRRGRLTDDEGHDFQLNDAFMRAVELLKRIEQASGGDS